MPNLDIRTLSLATAMILVVISLNLAYFRYTSDSLAGVGTWALGAFGGGVGFLLLGQRNIWPDWLTVVASNFLVGLFVTMIYLGLLRFLKRPYMRWRTVLWLISFGMGMMIFTYVRPSINMRIAILSLFLASICLACVKVLAWEKNRRGQRNLLLIICFGLLALVQGVRLVVALLARAEPTSFMSASQFHAMVFLIDNALIFLITTALVFMSLQRVATDLRRARAEVQHLSGLLPICSSCKRIRDDRGYWHQVETYIKSHSEAEFTHGICPDCMQRLYPEAAANILGSPGGCKDLTRTSLTPKP